MNAMFAYSVAFNQPLDNWNTANVINMNNVFAFSASFNQDIGAWKLNPAVSMVNMLSNCSVDFCNYSATLRGWANNNPTVTGRTLGAMERRYTTPVAIAERNTLIVNRGWTITGDILKEYVPYLMPEGLSITAVASCDDNIYIDPAINHNKIIGLDANGNVFNYSGATVTVTNEFAGTIPSGTTTDDIGGYYEVNSGSNTLRISRRMHAIQQTGTYNTNGGVIVRVYYDPAELSAITSNPVPAGSSPLIKYGWFKSSKHNKQDVVNDMTPANLLNAYQINPMATGTEGGVDYADFKLTSFSTIGYYAYTMPYVLPVTLINFNAASENCKVKLNWKTAEEISFSHFAIERSDDGINYTTIGIVNANGNNSNYSYIDNTPKDGKNIFRLKMIDADGKYKYSSLKLVTFSCNGAKSIVIYPNPASDNINISISGYTKQVQGKLFNTIGQLHTTTVLVNGTNNIPTTGLANGVYNLVITDESGNNTHHKVMVRH